MLRLIDNRRNIIFAVLPPLLFGLGSGLTILSNQLVINTAIWIFIAIVIFTGGGISLIRGMPTWGDTWLGTLFIFIALLLRMLMEEGKQAKLFVSPLVINTITVLVGLALLCLIFVVAVKGWRRTGLVGIGLSSTLCIGIWNTFARSPFDQESLALCVIPISISIALCIYFYICKTDKIRILAMVSIWLICLSTALISSFVYQGWFAERGSTFPVFTLIAILSLLLWGGPFIAEIVSITRKSSVSCK